MIAPAFIEIEIESEFDLDERNAACRLRSLFFAPGVGGSKKAIPSKRSSKPQEGERPKSSARQSPDILLPAYTRIDSADNRVGLRTSKDG